MVDRTLPVWLLPLNLILVLIVMLLIGRTWLWSNSLPEEAMLALRLVHQQIDEQHVEAHDKEALMWSAIEGMVQSLEDEHSEFIRPSEVEEFEEDTTGAYQGIGVLMVRDVSPITVEFPFPGGPSERAGLEPGDRILEVDGEPLVAPEGESLMQAARDRLLGPDGSEVQLTVERDPGIRLQVTVKRGSVQRRSVKWTRLLDRDAGIGYLFLSSFQHRSLPEMAEAIQRLDADAPDGLQALVLDLRFNRGGLLEQAVDIANLFVAEGTIVTLKRRSAEVERHEARPDRCLLPDTPIVILQNGGSASASEVVAGALQDHGRAKLVGTRSFGKGVVQSIYRWEELDFRLKLTTAHYYTPSGRSIERKHRRAEDGEAEGGIAPDVEVELDKEARTKLYEGLVPRTEIPARYREQVDALAEEHDFVVPAPLGPDEDTQLAAALREARVLVGVAPTGETEAAVGAPSESEPGDGAQAKGATTSGRESPTPTRRR